MARTGDDAALHVDHSRTLKPWTYLPMSPDSCSPRNTEGAWPCCDLKVLGSFLHRHRRPDTSRSRPSTTYRWSKHRRTRYAPPRLFMPVLPTRCCKKVEVDNLPSLYESLGKFRKLCRTKCQMCRLRRTASHGSKPGMTTSMITERDRSSNMRK